METLQSQHCSFIRVNKTEEDGLDNKQGRTGAGKVARLVGVRHKTRGVLKIISDMEQS